VSRRYSKEMLVLEINARKIEIFNIIEYPKPLRISNFSSPSTPEPVPSIQRSVANVPYPVPYLSPALNAG